MGNAISSFSGVLIVASMLGIPGKSWAADHTWTGFYVGPNIGAAWTDAKKTLTTPGDPSAPFFIPGDAEAIATFGSHTFGSEELSVGAQAGYNLQMGRVVIGAEVDVGRLGLKQRSASVNPTPAAGDITIATTVSAANLSTLRARVGLTAGSALVYATGGLAYSRMGFDQTTSFSGVPTNDEVSEKSHQFGWVVGGGVEWAWDNHWTIKGEYLYADLGSFGTTTNPVSPYGVGEVPLTHRMDLTAQVARAGLNYRY